MIVYGRNPVFEAIKCNRAHRVYIRKGAALYDIKFEIPVQILSKGEFESRFGRETQGIAAEVDEITTVSLDDVAEELNQVKGVVILDRIQDPHNYGAIIRSAHCFGIRHIIVRRYDQAPLTPTVCKASAGAVFYTTIIEETNLSQVCEKLKNLEFTVVAMDMDGATSLKEAGRPEKTAVIVGSEGKGIREGLLEAADLAVYIPMQGDIDSLNAAQSAAVVFYEFFGL